MVIVAALHKWEAGFAIRDLSITMDMRSLR
jgi:hypothetical protein